MKSALIGLRAFCCQKQHENRNQQSGVVVPKNYTYPTLDKWVVLLPALPPPGCPELPLGLEGLVLFVGDARLR